MNSAIYAIHGIARISDDVSYLCKFTCRSHWFRPNGYLRHAWYPFSERGSCPPNSMQISALFAANAGGRFVELVQP